VFLTDAVAMNDHSHLEKEWNFGAGPDKDRWQRVVALVIEHLGQHWGEVLEIGCAEGLITAEIARHASSLVAGDISPVACERTAERVRDIGHVRVVSLDLQNDPLDSYDVVFAMDVLEFVHGRSRVHRTLDKLVSAVRPGGLLVVSMCRYPDDIRDAWWQRWVPEGADSVLPLMAGHRELDQIHCEPHPADGKPIPGYLDHFIALFRRK
jgi:SAM-dependent methyltransferase